VQAADFLADLVHRLESRDLTYALVGSIATMSYGEPRATLDVDVVIALDRLGELLDRVLDSAETTESHLRGPASVCVKYR
jgi:hypothetical protein